MLKKYAFVLALAFTVLLAFFSLMQTGIPDIGFSFQDKIYHFIAYALMTLFWYNYLFDSHFKISRQRAIVAAVGIAVIYGIIIEVIQGQLTISRVAEFNDAIANTVGAIVAGLLIKFMHSPDVKN